MISAIRIASFFLGSIEKYSADPKRDKYYREEAKRIFSEVLKFRPTLREKNGEYALQLNIPTEIKKKYPELEIFVATEGKETGSKNSYFSPPGGIVIVLDNNYKRIIRDYTPQKSEIFDILKDKYTTFMHEFIHFLDYNRYKTLFPSVSYNSHILDNFLKEDEQIKEYVKYFTDPIEFNALYQEFLLRIESSFNKNKELKEFLDNNDFEGFYKHLEKIAPRDIAKFMFSSPKNPKKFELIKRKFRKRLYQQFQEWQSTCA